MKRKFIPARAAMTLLLAVLTTTGAWADNVTAEQARELALEFMTNRQSAGGPRRAPGKTLQLKQESSVSGLYVFNVADNGGFVIVSNDDRTIPILGYSDTGSIDPANLPANMKAWLQGYADEITWLKTQPAQNVQSVKSRAPKKAHNTTAIPKLLSTTWDQGTPYNAAVASKTGYNFATGCVATAMAQVMYYTETKAGNSTTATTKQIPAYTTYSRKLNINAVDKGTVINWGNMINDYSGEYDEGYTGTTGPDYNATQFSAVAYLMYYCGCSVQMDYNYTSNAYISDVDEALEDYFGYSTTTQYLSRSHYSYANWVDLIYNELDQGRPVIYGGQAVDNGHCFVCDGYEYLNGTDYFHINWGWSGNSDNYFVLSVLDPDNQGIGGSTSNSAYNSGQEAIVGIQKVGGTGTVLDVHVNTIDLTINSITPAISTIALGESVDITLNVTNNSSDAYDGELSLGINGFLGVGKMFMIPAKTTQDCVITFTPTAAGEYTLWAAAAPDDDGIYYWAADPNDSENPIAGTLTVVDQTPTDLVATNLTSETATIGWTNVGGATKWNLRSRPVTFEDFNGTTEWSTYKWSSKGGWEILSNGGINNSRCYASPSYFDGSDLDPDVGLYTPTFTLGGSISFYAWGENEKFIVYITNNGYNLESITGLFTTNSEPTKYTIPLSGYSGTGRIVIDHCYSSGHTSASYLYVDDVTIVEPSAVWSTVSDLTTNSYTISGLTAETSYEVQAQAVFDEAVSGWSNPLVFTTLSTGPTDLASTCSGTAATISWKARASETAWNLRYRVRDASYASYDFNGEFGHSDVTGGWQPAHWQSFDGDKDGRNWAVSASNGRNGSTCFISNSNASTAQPANCLYTPMFTLGGSVSFWMYGQNEDLYAYLVDENGKYISIVKYSTTATSEWKQHTVNLSAYTGTGRLVFVHDSNGTLYLDDVTIYEPSAWTTVSNVTNPYTITGLADNTTYGIQVQAVFSETRTSDWSDVLTFTTTVLELADDDSSLSTKNTDLLATWEGITANATLANRTLYKDGNWNTLCLPFALSSFAGTPLEGATVKAMNASDTSLDDNGKLTLQFTDATSIVAGKPYIVKWDKPTGYEGHESDYDIQAPMFNAAVITSTTPTAVTSADGKVTFVGQYSSFSVGDTGTGTFDSDLNEIILLSTNNQIGYSKNPRTLRAFRAHFYVPVPAGTDAKVRSFNVDFGDGDVNSIIAVSADSVGPKDSAWYTISGVRLNGKPTQKGLYIHQGKKIMVR